ncbi:MAG: glutamine-synthetase adenylyltransferase [Pseudomonadota bacterium]
MSFASAMTRCPRPFDPARGDDAVQNVPSLQTDLAALVRGAAGCSPYLAGLIQKEAEWLAAALDNIDQAVKALLEDVAETDLIDLPSHLRTTKRRIALIVALADLAGVWPLKKVTQTLTDFADAAVQANVTSLVKDQVKRGKLPSHLDATKGGGMAVLAMGKMGAGELNYSSDIDLICLFDETQFDPDDYHDVRSAFIRVTRSMAAMLSDIREGGYVFRTDLRLRPDASVTPVCLSMEAAERYYESVGRTWERAAYIKARVCAGDVAAGGRFLDTLRPFVWRKHLDFTAIQDAHDMRLKIRDHKGLGGPLTLEGHNMKLGRGGIREIEFFTQTRQLIAGGRDPSLRVRRTDDGLARLAEKDWIAQETAHTLHAHYVAHREVEHRVQMINDAQTHQLPPDDAGFERLAALMDTDVGTLRRSLTDRLIEVHGLTEGFFAPDTATTAPVKWGEEVVARWHNYPALRSARATEIFDRLTPDIMARLLDAAKPDEALAQFDEFLRGLPAGVQLFSLFEANPQLTQLIVDIAATAPALSQYLSRNAGVFDAVIGGTFFSDWPGVGPLQVQLVAVLKEQKDYEAQLIAARRWAKEWHFRIGVHHLRGLITAAVAGQHYADLAETVIAALWPVVVAEFASKHGVPPGRGAAVLAMGSLGASQLNANSDLDLIMIYDADGVEVSDGARPLATRAYFSRLTQALVTALSAPMSEGRLYEVDMRLRPSGRQGPVATSFGAFRDYQSNEAWTWEHLALTRGRVVAGDAALAKEVEAFRLALLAEKADGPTVSHDVQDMRRRLAEAKPPQGAWDAKMGPGRLQDIELLAQTVALRAQSAERTVGAQLQAGITSGWADAEDIRVLVEAAEFLWTVQAAGKLLTGGVLDPETLGEGAKRLLLRESGCDDLDGFLAKLTTTATRADACISSLLEKDGK